MPLISKTKTLVILGATLLTFSLSGCYRADGVNENEGKRSSKAKRSTQSQRSSELRGPHKSGFWNSDTRTELGKILRRYLGMPYKGTSKYEPGIDCSRFTAEVYEAFDGRKLPRVSRAQARIGLKISRAGLRYGDLIFFTIVGDRISHVGIYVGNNEFVHASASRGVVIDNINESYWRKRFHSGRRLIKYPGDERRK
ncbi:C40 family peptidase [Gemmatimonas aurantiaca]|nr:C40 family peptidase [Gemmatimonas aurantiaca]